MIAETCTDPRGMIQIRTEKDYNDSITLEDRDMKVVDYIEEEIERA